MNPNRHLDEIIRDALKNLEADYNPDSWEMLEERINAEPAGNEMLDGLIARKLSGIESLLPDANWDMFQKKLEAEDAVDMIEEELEIDNLAYEKLQNYEASLGSSQWPRMAQRLEEEFSLRYKLIRYKVAEMALVFLIILTIIRFMPLAEGVLENGKERGNSGITQIEKPTYSAISDQSLAHFNLDYPRRHNWSISGKAPILHSSSVNETLASPEIETPENSHSIFRTKILDELNVLAGNTMLVTNSSEINLKHKAIGSTISNEIRNYRSANPKVLQNTGQVVSLTSKPEPELSLAPVHAAAGQGKLRFGVLTTGDYNYVFSPSESIRLIDTLISTKSEITGAIGYGGGFTVSLKKGNFEFLTGGIYSFKRYVPNTPIFLFKTVKYYVEENFHGIQQDMLHIPFNVQYHYKDAGNWRLYGLIGASMHFITSSVYEIRYTLTPAFNFAAPGAPGNETQSFLKGKEFPKGLADGGKLKDNLYMTANIGFGIERYVTPNWSLYFQPDYQHYLNSSGIGTNKDKFYTFSIQLGAKVSLK